MKEFFKKALKVAWDSRWDIFKEYMRSFATVMFYLAIGWFLCSYFFRDAFRGVL